MAAVTSTPPFETFRALALALEGVVEGAHMGHPDFRVNGRVFASLQHDNLRGMTKVTPELQAALIAENEGVFSPASGAWGRQGYTMLDLHAASPALMRSALLLAWEAAMAQPRKTTKKPPSRRRASRVPRTKR